MQLKTLYKHRSVWMGIAILVIVFYHVELVIPNMLIATFKKIAYGGVDIFIFASGLGAYFSYTKDFDATAFLIRRFKRLAPIYIPFIVIWNLYRYFGGDFPINAAIGNFFALQGFTGLGNEFSWYITCLMVVYILTPFFGGLVKKMNRPHSYFLFAIFLFIISIPFWDTWGGIIIVSRLPIYVIGMYFAKWSEDDKIRLKSKLAFVLIAAMVVGMMLLLLFFKKYDIYLWDYGLYWYPFIFITPGVCIFISVFAEVLGKIKFGRIILNILKKIGEYSFEIFLLHAMCLDIYQKYLIPNNVLPQSNRSAFFVLLLVIPLSLLLRMCSKGCTKICNWCVQKRTP